MGSNKKGSTMVEAAVVFPLVILSVTALIYMLIFLYQQAEVRAQMHIALRADSGGASGTMEYLPKPKGRFPVCRKGDQSYYKGQLTFLEKGLLRGKEKELSAHGYIDDEVKFIRYVDLLRQKE